MLTVRPYNAAEQDFLQPRDFSDGFPSTLIQPWGGEFEMNWIKALLPASTVRVTLLAGVPGACAADLSARQAAPIEYVRICDAICAGCFFIPVAAASRPWARWEL
jgi:hypothetical protein